MTSAVQRHGQYKEKAMVLTLKEPYLDPDNGSVAGCYNRSMANAVGVKME